MQDTLGGAASVGNPLPDKGRKQKCVIRESNPGHLVGNEVS